MQSASWIAAFLCLALPAQPEPRGPANSDRPMLGRVATDRTIRLEAMLDRPPAEVFKLWTTVEGVQTFFCSDARIADRPGGPYEIYFLPAGHPMHDAAGTQGAHLLAMESPRFLSFEWKGKPGMDELRSFPLPTWVELTFDPAGPGGRQTHLKLEHFGFREGKVWDEAFDYFGKQAWPLVLRRLTKACVDSTDRPRPKAAVQAAPAADGEAAARQAGGSKAEQEAAAQKPAAQTPAEQAPAAPAPAAPAPAAQAVPRPYFAVLVSRGKGWKPLSEWDPRVMAGHLAHIQEQASRGAAMLAGPFADESGGGLTILRVESAEAASRIFESDPCVQAGYLKFEVHPWMVMLGSAAGKD